MRLSLPLFFLLLCPTLGFSAEAEEEENYLHIHSMVGVGVAYQSVESDLRASVGDLPEVKLDLDDLGMKRDDWSWALEGRWRFKPKWVLVGLAYQYDQTGDRSVKRDFNFDGKEFQAGASVDTELTINTYIVDLMYSVYSSERSELLLGGGIHAIDLDVSITGKAFVDKLEKKRATGGSEILAPLPNLRAQGFYKLGENWGVGFAAGWLSANYDSYDGSFVYFHPRLYWGFSDHWALSAGYQFVDIDLTQEKSSNRENEFNVDFQGPTAFINYRF